jgi:alpha-glucoside transport system permease protein
MGQARRRRGPGRRPARRPGVALAFLAPALVFLGALVCYPIVFTVVRSLLDRSGDAFIGLGNYREIFTRPATLTALRNNLIWAVVAPTLTTALGLVLAVLAQRMRWQTAFRIALFMPMAISFLAAGIVWRLVYDRDPGRGLANAVIGAAVSAVRPAGPYPGARPSQPDLLTARGQGFVSAGTYRPDAVAGFGLVAVPRRLVPSEAVAARSPGPRPDSVHGVVWLDFTPGGGTRGQIDGGESGLPGVPVEGLEGDRVVAATVTAPDGTFALSGIPSGGVRLHLKEAAFRPPFTGIPWLGPDLVTPAIIIAYIWMWTGFALVVLGAGLAAVPREALEAARVDGAGEWHVFRRITIPLLRPALAVVLVTLLINVLKIFDLVLVVPPGSVQADATVIALEMWRAAFAARDHGLASALAVVLFLLVTPPMLLSLLRFRRRR